MIKFIHTADWHLGMQAHFLPDEARARFAQDRFAAVRRICELARQEECAFVVVAGDVFDSNYVDRQVVAKAIDALSSSTVPVFLLPGNHDPLDPSSVFRTKDWLDHKPANVEVLEESVAIPVPGVPQLEVVGCPWRTKHQLSDPLTGAHEVCASPGDALRVVVGHGIVDELGPDSNDPGLIRAAAVREALAGGGAHYVALGDRHSVTPIPGADGRAFYAGAPVATDYGEVDPNKVLVVSLQDGGCGVEQRTIGDWHFEREVRDLTGTQDVTALEQWLEAMPSKATTVVKLGLRGTLSLADRARLSAGLELNGMTFASLDSWDRRSELVVAPDEADLARLDVSGYVLEALRELRAQAAGADEEAAIAGDALNLLYRLAQ